MLCVELWCLVAMGVTEFVVAGIKAGLGGSRLWHPHAPVVVGIMIIITWPIMLMIALRAMFDDDEP